MRFEIKKGEGESSRFYLTQDGESIVLNGVDPEGYDWMVLQLTPKQPVKLFSSVSSLLGISIDTNGYVKTTKGY